MGKFPLLVLLVLLFWIGLTVWREGPEETFGGLFAVLVQPLYGEGEPPRGRNEALADRAYESPPPPEERGDERPWWAR